MGPAVEEEPVIGRQLKGKVLQAVVVKVQGAILFKTSKTLLILLSSRAVIAGEHASQNPQRADVGFSGRMLALAAKVSVSCCRRSLPNLTPLKPATLSYPKTDQQSR
jgi:hypothetical protein